MSPEKAQSIIKEAARNAIEKIGLVKPFMIPIPFNLRVEYIEAKYAKGITTSLGVTRLDEVTIIKKCHNLDDIVF